MIVAIGYVGIKGVRNTARAHPRRIRALRSLFCDGVSIRPLGQPVSLRWLAGPPHSNA